MLVLKTSYDCMLLFVQLIEGGHSNILAHMLDHDAKPDIPDRQGSTPLHVAAEMGDNHAVQLLLAKDTQIDAINKVRENSWCISNVDL